MVTAFISKSSEIQSFSTPREIKPYGNSGEMLLLWQESKKAQDVLYTR